VPLLTEHTRPFLGVKMFAVNEALSSSFCKPA
jgi:hypothetical protein